MRTEPVLLTLTDSRALDGMHVIGLDALVDAGRIDPLRHWYLLSLECLGQIAGMILQDGRAWGTQDGRLVSTMNSRETDPALNAITHAKHLVKLFQNIIDQHAQFATDAEHLAAMLSARLNPGSIERN